MITFQKGDLVRIDPRTRRGGSKHWGRGRVTENQEGDTVMVKPLGGHKKAEPFKIEHVHHWMSKKEMDNLSVGPYWIVDMGKLTVFSSIAGEGLTPLFNHAKDFPTEKGARIAATTMAKSNGRLKGEISEEGLEVMPKLLAKLYIEEQELNRRKAQEEEQKELQKEQAIVPANLTVDELSNRSIELTRSIQQSMALIDEAKKDVVNNFAELQKVQEQLKVKMSREIKNLDKPVLKGETP